MDKQEVAARIKKACPGLFFSVESAIGHSFTITTTEGYSFSDMTKISEELGTQDLNIGSSIEGSGCDTCGDWSESKLTVKGAK